MRDLGETDIHSFAIGFEEASFDESPFAKQVADYLNTVHHESRKALQAGDLLFDLVRHYGQPYGDSSAIPTWYLCQETRGHVTVALSGDGGDELFCGYQQICGSPSANGYGALYSVFPMGTVKPDCANNRHVHFSGFQRWTESA